MKKASKLTVLFLSFLLILSAMPFSAIAASAPNIRYVGETDRIDAEYGWTFKFIDGITTTERFGFTPNPEDYYYLSWDSNGTYVTKLLQSDYDICRITNDSQKGNVGEIYHNVGKYQGNTVSLKVTVLDWDKLSAPGTINRADGVGNGKPNYPFISFGLNNFNIDISQYPKIYNAELKYELFDENTGKPLTIKGHNTFKDIDGTSNSAYEYGECISFSNASELDLIVLSENTVIRKSTDGTFNAGQTGNCTNNDKTHWIEMLFNSSTLTFKLNSIVSDREGIEKTHRGYNHFFFSADTLAPFTTPKITKTVDKTALNGGDNLNYSLEFYLPFVEEKFCYNTLIVIDKLAKILEINSLEIINDAYINVNDQFTVENDGETLTVFANNPTDDSLYNTAYTINISANINCDDSALFSKYIDKGKCLIENTATIITNAGSTSSNTVETELTYALKTEITNGTISPGDNTVVPCSDKTVCFTPNKDYYVSSIIVDGNVIDDIASYKNGGSISFSNIIANHNINVVCTEYDYFNINITYVDENSMQIAEPYNQSVRAETEYNLFDIANKSIQYYTLESIEGSIEGTVNGNINIIVHYVRNSNTISINYLEKGTNKTLKESFIKTYSQGTEFNVFNEANQSIEYYTLYSVEGSVQGTIKTDTVINCFYTRNKNKVTVNYYDSKTGDKLLDSIAKTFSQGTDYNLSADVSKDIPYYTRQRIIGNVTGLLVNDEIINVYYTRNKNIVTVNYYETGTGNKLKESYSEIFDQGTEYDLKSIAEQNIEYYTIEHIEGITTGTILDDIEINVYYTRNQNTLTINFIDKMTNEVISSPLSKIFNQGIDYDVSVDANRDIPYYTYIDSEGNLYGVILSDETISSYYMRNLNTITINYLEAESGIPISESYSNTCFQGTNYDVNETAHTDIQYYSIQHIDGSTTGFLTEDVIINVYYKHNIGQVITNYIDENGNTLADSKASEGYVPDEYSTSAKTIYGYELTVVPNNASGTYTEGTITVDYIYTLKDSKVVVNYMDNAGNKLSGDYTINGKVFDKYQTEPKNIDGYILSSSPDNKDGTMQEETIIVTYVYDKSPLHIDKPDDEKPFTSPKTGADYTVVLSVGSAIGVALLCTTYKRKKLNA